MALKDNTFEIKIKFKGNFNFEDLCKIFIDTMKAHAFKIIEDTFEKKNVDKDKFNYKIVYSGSKSDKPWTNYEFKYTIKGKNITEIDGELEIEGELKINYTNPYKSKSKIFNKIKGVDTSIYKEKEKYLEDIYKELGSKIKQLLNDDFF